MDTTFENRYQGWFPESVEEVRDYIINMPRTFEAADTCSQFAIIGTDDNQLIGDMGIVFTNHDNMQAEIGCTLNLLHYPKIPLIIPLQSKQHQIIFAIFSDNFKAHFFI